MHKKGRGKTESLDPLTLPMTLITALDALYGHYEKTYTEWTKPESRFGRDRITRSQQPLAFFRTAYAACCRGGLSPAAEKTMLSQAAWPVFAQADSAYR
jgi:hypothetical protein